MIMQMLFKKTLFLFVKKIYLKCTQRKIYCVTCPNATKICLVEYRLKGDFSDYVFLFQ